MTQIPLHFTSAICGFHFGYNKCELIMENMTCESKWGKTSFTFENALEGVPLTRKHKYTLKSETNWSALMFRG